MTDLNGRSKQVRLATLELSKACGGYHYGGCFSATEILICLYDEVLKPEDKFILSKGHACWPYYVLLRERGYEPRLDGHPVLDNANGVHYTTGSEGHGFPAAVGMALARKIAKREGRIYVLVGDGECQEGTTWESMLQAPHHGLDNLTVIVDWNGIQGAGFVKDILPVRGMGECARELGWTVIECDGHTPDKLQKAFNATTRLPKMIIAHTVKGKGVSFMENKPEWHANWPNEEYEAQMRKELG